MRLRRILFVFSIVLYTNLLTGCGSGSSVEGLYTAVTADGVDIKIRRYRPDPTHNYNNTQPIVLFPGILLNINQFLSHTPKGQKFNYRRMDLPNDLADWAIGDEYIEDDPMVYYNLSHYLWLQGYDVWLANYRGIGRDDFESEKGNTRTNLDVWAALDTPAVINKVKQVTGKKPVIGGHSTGGLVSYLYLQGVTMDPAPVRKGDYIPHLESSAALAAQRNAGVVGFLGIDPAGSPTLAYESLIDNGIIWTVLAQRWYLDLDYMVGEIIIPLLPPALTSSTVSLIFNTVSNLSDAFPAWLLPDTMDLFGAVNFWQTDQMNRYTSDYVGRMSLSSLYLRSLSQYADWGINGTFREHWMNGEENKDRINPPDVMDNDGYYRFNDNMSRMTVPALSIFSDSSGLVDTDAMVEILYNGKTYHHNDDWIEIEGSGHVDITTNENAPTILFPTIGEWLDNL